MTNSSVELGSVARMRHQPAIAQVERSFDPAEEARLVQVRRLRHSVDEVTFELDGVEAPFANAIRRILIAEVPTMAIEHVTVMDNSTVTVDEFLAHRLGLVPVLVDPRLFQFRKATDAPSPQNTLRFRLRIPPIKGSVFHGKNGSAEDPYSTATAEQPISVYSDDIVWEPFDAASSVQALETMASTPDHDRFKQTTDVCGQGATSSANLRKDQLQEVIPKVQPGILLTKVLRGQRLDITMEAVKGLGQEHAKWSPVATAFYRMAPKVHLKGEIRGMTAETLRDKCPMGVFEIEETSGALRVVCESKCTLCGECVRGSERKDLDDSNSCRVGTENSRKLEDPYFRTVYESDHVKVGHETNRFLFSIESAGQYRADVLFGEALMIIREKCLRVLESLEANEANANFPE